MDKSVSLRDQATSRILYLRSNKTFTLLPRLSPGAGSHRLSTYPRPCPPWRQKPHTDSVSCSCSHLWLAPTLQCAAYPPIPTVPPDSKYVGVEFARGLCGVSVIRSGEAMEAALRECCQGIKIGKILVHRWGPDSKEREKGDGTGRMLRMDEVARSWCTAWEQGARERGGDGFGMDAEGGSWCTGSG